MVEGGCTAVTGGSEIGDGGGGDEDEDEETGGGGTRAASIAKGGGREVAADLAGTAPTPMATVAVGELDAPAPPSESGWAAPGVDVAGAVDIMDAGTSALAVAVLKPREEPNPS